MLALTLPGLAGCSPGTAGLVSGEVLDADGAEVLVVDGYGLSLRGTPVDRGLTVGYARRVYVYPEETPGLPAPGRHLFWVPQPAEPPMALNGEAIGLDLSASRVSVGVTLGYHGTALLAYVPQGEAVHFRLRFAPSDPAATQLRFCREGKQFSAIDLDSIDG
jgi:hypothetical protein